MHRTTMTRFTLFRSLAIIAAFLLSLGTYHVDAKAAATTSTEPRATTTRTTSLPQLRPSNIKRRRLDGGGEDYSTYGNKNTYNYQQWKQEEQQENGGNYEWRKNNYHAQYGYNNNNNNQMDEDDDWDGFNNGYWNEDGDWVQYTSEDGYWNEDGDWTRYSDEENWDEEDLGYNATYAPQEDDRYDDDIFVSLKEARRTHSLMEFYRIGAVVLACGALALLLYGCSLRSSIASQNRMAAKRKEVEGLYQDIEDMLVVP